MSKMFVLPVLSCLMLVACVAHDPDEVEVNEPQEVYLQPSEARPARTVVVQAQQPAQPKTIVVQGEAQPSWWQQNRQRHKVKVVVPSCPCKDPNDPCTHCYQK